MKIIGIDGLPPELIVEEIQRGGKFVVYEYCISIIVMTFKRRSDVYYVRPGESRVVKGAGFTLLSAVLGWWGFPWGPIYTIGSFITNFGGGKDVTMQVASSLFPQVAAPMPAGWGQGIQNGQPPADPAPNYYSGPPR